MRLKNIHKTWNKIFVTTRGLKFFRDTAEQTLNIKYFILDH